MRSIEDAITKCPSHLLPMLPVAVDAACSAGEMIKGLYNKPHKVRMKGDIDLVTEADVASEEKIMSMIGQVFPDHLVIAEESSSGMENISSGSVWIIDPLDGTTNFAHGFSYFAVSIAFLVDGQREIGVVYNPVHDELFVALRGGGAYLNGVAVFVSQSSILVESLVATGFPYNIQGNLEKVLGQFGRVLPAVRDIRRAGAAALDLAYVACGRLDGFWEMDLKPWDTAAGSLLVEEAGGKISCFSENMKWTPQKPEIVASNGKIHPDLISRLS